MMSTEEEKRTCTGTEPGETLGSLVWQAAVEEAELRAEELVQIALQETLEARQARDEAIKELEVVKILVGSERRNHGTNGVEMANLEAELQSTRNQVDDLSRLVATQAETIARLRRKAGLLEAERLARAEIAKAELESTGSEEDSDMVIDASGPDDVVPLDSASAPGSFSSSFLKHSIPRSKFHRETKPYSHSPSALAHWQGAEGATHCFNCQTSTTPLWRRDTIGNVLCNACGLYYKVHKSHRPYLATAKSTTGARRDRVVNKADAPRECDHCRTSSTPLWRKDKDGNLNLCNACGLYEKLHGATRPLPDRQDTSDGYRRRKRWQSTSASPR